MKEEINLDFEEFVYGLRNNTIQLEVLPPTKENREIGFFEKWSLSSIVNKIFVFLTYGPILLIPFICFKTGNWLLLLGFIGFLLGLIFTEIVLRTPKPKKEFLRSILIFTFLAIVLILLWGVFHFITFIIISFYYSYFVTFFSNWVFDALVKTNLTNNPVSYYGAKLSGRIKTYRI